MEGRIRNYLINRIPLSGLLRELGGDIKVFIRDEIALVIRETLEKFSSYGRDAVFVVAGAGIAYAGVIVTLAGIGMLVGFGLEQLDMDPMLAAFIGFLVAGLLVGAIGGAMAFKGIKMVSGHTLLPQPMLEIVKHGGKIPPQAAHERGPLKTSTHRSTEELQQEADATRQRIDLEKEEIKRRFTPGHVKELAVEHVKRHPVAWAAAGLAGLALGGVVIGRKYLKT